MTVCQQLLATRLYASIQRRSVQFWRRNCVDVCWTPATRTGRKIGDTVRLRRIGRAHLLGRYARMSCSVCRRPPAGLSSRTNCTACRPRPTFRRGWKSCVLACPSAAPLAWRLEASTRRRRLWRSSARTAPRTSRWWGAASSSTTLAHSRHLAGPARPMTRRGRRLTRRTSTADRPRTTVDV